MSGSLYDWGYLVIWEFQARPETVAAFVQAYGPSGDWVKLFRGAYGYLGTELVRDVNSPQRFITIDFWSSRQDYDEFRIQHGVEYKRIDEKCAQLTLAERLVGEFEPAVK
ncbi:MAG TPA: antibiotic biosynthesis monooxygenase [Terriglobales bacterium]|nr:antibiotic biosynthesis monooxygenase [Terriglobales bacterium]